MSIGEWILAVVAALGVGIGKAGLSGMSMFHVLVFAFLFGARASTGVVLPLLLVGDVAAVRTFHQHARWDYVRRMLPPACLGVVLAAWFMRDLDETLYRPVIGWVTLILSILQFVRMYRPDWFGNVPHARWFAWTMGILAGAATMLANAAGTGVRDLPHRRRSAEDGVRRHERVVLFHHQPVQGAVQYRARAHPRSDADVEPDPGAGSAGGVLAGRWLLERIPQRLFEHMLLAFAVLAALRLIGAF
jgi:uncharacterized membrane protein YfcA